MTNENKPIFDKQTLAPLLAGTAIVLVLFVIVSALGPKRPDSASGTAAQNGDVIAPPVSVPESVPEPEPEPEKISRPPVKTTTPTDAIDTYEEAIEAYAGLRFQFTACRGTPGSLTVKNGSTFLLDNRDASGHTIVVGTKSYWLGAYGWKIVTASEEGTLNITCDGGGSASINVQP